MAITNRNLEPGTRLVATYKKIEYSAVVQEDGTIRIDSDAAEQPVFKSLSAAGSAIMEGIACNGWRFWSTEGEQPERPEKPEGSEGTAKPKSKKMISRTPNQQGVPEGHIKIFCNGCMKSHVVEGDSVPAACPEGHGAA